RHFPALLVRIEEGRLRFVAVELADLDGLLRERRSGEAPGKRGGEREVEQATPASHEHATIAWRRAGRTDAPLLVFKSAFFDRRRRGRIRLCAKCPSVRASMSRRGCDGRIPQ